MNQPTILHEDNHLLLLNKPAGWLVQGDRTGDRTLPDWGKAYLKEKYAKPGEVFLHPVHRLDRPVSGVVLLARTSKALERLSKNFRERDLSKTYWAVVLGKPPKPADELRHFLVKDTNLNIVKSFAKPPGRGMDAKEGILRYESIGTFGNLSLLKINPLTGRSHQIRVQLAAIGCPIAGDLKYGAPEPLADASIGLHALRLSFEHPVRHEPLEVDAPLPTFGFWKPFRELL
jgi:23S rRNA pseudouridine1911/1915/1917 synthase